MPVFRTLPLYVLLLAACAEPARTSQQYSNHINPGPGCQDECAAGFRWAVEREFTDEAKCRGESETARGCREAIALMHPLARH
jgi:hypothetical protein